MKGVPRQRVTQAECAPDKQHRIFELIMLFTLISLPRETSGFRLCSVISVDQSLQKLYLYYFNT